MDKEKKSKKDILIEWLDNIGAFHQEMNDGRIYYCIAGVMSIEIDNESPWVRMYDIHWLSVDENDKEQIGTLWYCVCRYNHGGRAKVVFNNNGKGKVQLSTIVDFLFTQEDNKFMNSFHSGMSCFFDARDVIRAEMDIHDPEDDSDDIPEEDAPKIKDDEEYNIPSILTENLTKLGYKFTIDGKDIYDDTMISVEKLDETIFINADDTFCYPMFQIAGLYEFKKGSSMEKSVRQVVNILNQSLRCTFTICKLKNNDMCSVSCVFFTSIFPGLKEYDTPISGAIDLLLIARYKFLERLLFWTELQGLQK